MEFFQPVSQHKTKQWNQTGIEVQCSPDSINLGHGGASLSLSIDRQLARLKREVKTDRVEASQSPRLMSKSFA